MSTSPSLLVELRDADVHCHCGGDVTGHHLGVIACESPRITRTPTARPEVGGVYGRTVGKVAASTCAECGRPDGKVELREARIAAGPHDLPPGVLLARVPALAPHRRPGRRGGPCPGGGARPAETRWRFPEVDAIVRAYGPGAVSA